MLNQSESSSSSWSIRSMIAGAVILMIAVILLLFLSNFVPKAWDYLGEQVSVIMQDDEELACTERGKVFDQVCSNTMEDAVMVALGSSPDPVVSVTVFINDEELTAMSDIAIERYFEDKVVEVQLPVAPIASTVVLTSVPVVEQTGSTVVFGQVVTQQATAHMVDCLIISACGYVRDPGVISSNVWADANGDGNDSTTFISPLTQFSLENNTGEADLPENGWMMVTAAGFTFQVDGFTPETMEVESEVESFLIIKGLAGYNAHNLNVYFSGYNPGSIAVTRFPVPRGAGEYFSGEYLQQNVDSSLENNCDDGCSSVNLTIFDANTGAYQVYQYTDKRGWQPAS